MKEKTTNVLSTERHFVILTYAFNHCFVFSKQGEHQLANLDTFWDLWWNRFEGKNINQAVDDTYFFLPHVRSLLFPEVTNTPKSTDWQAWLSKITHEDIEQKVSPTSCLHLTRKLETFDQKFHLEMNSQYEQFQCEIQIHWVDVWLFPQSAGFLTLKVELVTDSQDSSFPSPLKIKDLTNVLYHLRLVQPPNITWTMLRWRSRGTPTLDFTSQDLVDYLLQGLTKVSASIDYHTIGQYVLALQQNSVPRYSTTDIGMAYGQSFRLFMYACLDETSAPMAKSAVYAEEQAESSSEAQHARSEANPEVHHDEPPSQMELLVKQLLTKMESQSLFEDVAQQSLYEMATCTDTSLTNYKPHANGVKKLFDQGYIAIWDNWQAMALHDNTVFLATIPNGFTRFALPHNIEGDYFQLYMLCLYQKVRLNWFSGELIRRHVNLYKNLREARNLWEDFIHFRNNIWFGDVTFRPQGYELYRSFQRGLGSKDLYETVSCDIRELQDHYETKAERRIGDLLNVLTLVGLPIGILAEVYGDHLLNVEEWPGFLVVAGIILIVWIGGWIAWRRRTARDRNH